MITNCHRRHSCFLLLLPVLILLATSTLVCVRADTVDERLQHMSSAELAMLEKELRSQVDQHNNELESMRLETERLKKEQKVVDEEAAKLVGDKQYELQEKAKREKELEAAKQDVLEKQESISKMSSEVANLKEHIGELDKRLEVLRKDKDTTENRFKHPSLTDVLEARSQGMSNVTKNVYQKTLQEVVPMVSEMTGSIRDMRKKVSRTSKFLEVFVSLVIYAFIIAAIIAIYTIYNKVKGKLTIGRLLFLGDAFCGCFWTVMLICFMILFEDPLYTMKQRLPALFFVFQLVACFSYVNFVLLRVLVLASKMTLGALGETLAVVVVGHHYYVRVWQPSMLDRPFRGTFFYYFCYAWLFAAFAYNRVQEFAPLKQLRGPKLPFFVWISVLYARFTKGNVPDGDIESSPYDEDDEDEHEK